MFFNFIDGSFVRTHFNTAAAAAAVDMVKTMHREINSKESSSTKIGSTATVAPD